MSGQKESGKAFEYALLAELFHQLDGVTPIRINRNSSYQIAKSSFDNFTKSTRRTLEESAQHAVKFLIDVEPRLQNGQNENDILELELVSDGIGQAGDVRDVITLRAQQRWEIGISAKNNHRAVKHSRLSMKIDFGSKWLDIPCSKEYFDSIEPVFSMLKEIKDKDRSTKWDVIDNMHDIVYVPILKAFRVELLRLASENSDKVASNLVKYLIGRQDFYKVIRTREKVEIQAYNINGTLNQSTESERAKFKLPRLKLPSRLIEVVFKKDSKTTLLVSLDEGWQISFRIHNASSRVEPSLKFDINLVSAPHTLFTQHIFI